MRASPSSPLPVERLAARSVDDWFVAGPEHGGRALLGTVKPRTRSADQSGVEDFCSGVGSSTADDGFEAGAEAARRAVGGLVGAEPALVLVFTSVRYDLPRLVAGVRSVTAAAPLAGATSAGHLVGGEQAAPGTGVAVMVLGGARYRFGVGSAEGMGERPDQVGELLATAAKAAAGTDGHDAQRPHAAVLLLTDGLGGDSQRVLKGVHRVAGAAVPVVGGAAGDDRQMAGTWVMHDDRVLVNGAVGVWIASPQPLVVAVEHGWVPVSPPEIITGAEGLTIQEIGGLPAAQVYAQHAVLGDVGAQLAEDGESEASYGLGVIEPDGTHSVRGVYPLPGGALGTFTGVEEFSAVQVVTADAQSVLSVVEPVVRTAIAAVARPRALLVFDCVGRADILGAAVQREVALMSAAADGAEVFGFYGYGEFARTRGTGGTHNATLCALAL